VDRRGEGARGITGPFRPISYLPMMLYKRGVLSQRDLTLPGMQHGSSPKPVGIFLNRAMCQLRFSHINMLK
jgi:hypothetical protein